VLPQDNRGRGRVIASITAGVLLLIACLAAGSWALSRAGQRISQLAGPPRLGADHHGQPPIVPPPASGDVLVDESVAKSVLRQYWPIHERALVESDLATLSRLSEGPAREWEVSAVACSCYGVDAVRPLVDALYFVPRQTTYPAYFVTEASTVSSGDPKAEMLVFTKDGPSAPWRVTQDSALGAWPGQPLNVVQPENDGTGFNRPVSPTAHRRAQTAAADLARVWQLAKDKSKIVGSSEFELSGQAGARVAELASHPQEPEGGPDHIQFYASLNDPLVEVASTGGSALACQVIRFTHVYRAGPSDPLVQGFDRRAWGPDIAPGRYHEITRIGLWPTCFMVPADPAQRIVVLNHELSGGRSTGIR
jgi:hypothetical protein